MLIPNKFQSDPEQTANTPAVGGGFSQHEQLVLAAGATRAGAGDQTAAASADGDLREDPPPPPPCPETRTSSPGPAKGHDLTRTFFTVGLAEEGSWALRTFLASRRVAHLTLESPAAGFADGMIREMDDILNGQLEVYRLQLFERKTTVLVGRTMPSACAESPSAASDLVPAGDRAPKHSPEVL